MRVGNRENANVTRSGKLIVLVSGMALAVLATASPAQAQKKSLEQVLQEQVNELRAVADAFASIKDKASADAAAPKIKEGFRRGVELRRQQTEAMAGVSAEEMQRLVEKFEPQIEALRQRLHTEAVRIEGLRIPLPDGLSNDPNIRANVPASSTSTPATPPPPAPGGMAFLFPLLLVLIIIGCVAFLYTEGIWSNAIRLINVVTAALIATNFWEPVARWLEGFGESFTYYWDLLALWGLFAISMLVFRSITSGLSKQKVKFLQIADNIGGGVLAAVVAWVMVCFITFTLHTAPLARNFMFGGFTPDSRMLMGLGPDRQWLGFVRNVSRGVYCRYGNDDNRYGSEPDPSSSAQKLCVFDREGWFISRYAARRSALEKHVAEKGATRVESGAVKR